MLRDRAYDLLIGQGYNCAETMLHLCDEAFDLKLQEETYLALGVFGAGLASGEVCGAVAAAEGVLGVLYNQGEFNKSPDCKQRVQLFLKRVRELCGDTQCRVLRPKYFEPGIRCLHLVEQVADLLEEIAR